MTDKLKSCLTCGKQFSPRSLQEHLQSSHLGTQCFFPGFPVRLDSENDLKMSEALIHANTNEGGGAAQNQATNATVFVCAWPACKLGQGHTYDRLTSLKRHLRTRQRDEYCRNLNDALALARVRSPAPPVPGVPAWSNLHLHLALLNAKFQCLEILVTPSPGEVVNPNILHRMLQDIRQTDVAMWEALRCVQVAPECWGQLELAREEWEKKFAAWFCVDDVGSARFYELSGLLAQLTQSIEHIQTC
ncbi:uncharacterized protein GGS22DRAFT_156499 [Annulohypoxylon maeteangense]|uniref:uncharacterized protein n=1 Tax=Annulohypoxylon maeteangense TaxID=1927788 RepID=UPI002007510B|nr:uncharacterized protein GGS22DRAFT_156499 [Annulohypoxylon maeteangense]KAI0887234.1 hypothetical protein GGS22DRAFT_156499 [Annulohypoxylon maeteangense]